MSNRLIFEIKLSSKPSLTVCMCVCVRERVRVISKFKNRVIRHIFYAYKRWRKTDRERGEGDKRERE